MAPFPHRDAKGNLTGLFEVDVRTKQRRFRKRFDRLEDAKHYEACVRATGTAPAWADDASSVAGPTFQDAADACRKNGGPEGKWKRGRDRSIQQRLAYVCRIIGHIPIADVTTDTLDQLVDSLEDRPGQRTDTTLTGETINRYLTAASAVLTYAQARPKVYPGLTRPKVPWRPKGAAKIVWYTPEQEDAICRVLPPEVALCVRVLAATGLRVGELLALAPADVEDNWLRLWKTKTDRPRSVPIPPALARDLRALIGSSSVPNYNMIYKKVAEAVGKCGYSPELNVHALRHTTATRLIQQGVNPVVVQRFLGHKSIQTTMRYAHVQDDDLLTAAKKLLPIARANSEHDENVVIPYAKKA